ncbi:MAG: hypothetical protein KDJ65_07555 [Anaerolineae bacterium]|nr:hypothetical protein [Anaerolineae bacterium]
MTDNQTPAINPEEEEFTILIEWPGQHGNIQKAARSGDALQVMYQKSQKAVNLAMWTIQAMAYRISKTMNALEEKVRPDEAEVEFGINLDAEAGAMLAKASTGAQIKVKLKWTVEEPQRTKILVSE